MRPEKKDKKQKYVILVSIEKEMSYCKIFTELSQEYEKKFNNRKQFQNKDTQHMNLLKPIKRQICRSMKNNHSWVKFPLKLK